MATAERLQKVLARAGIASRRHAEELITGGRVRVNGRVVTALGTRVDPRRDKVEVDGRRITAEPLVYYMFHKPRSTVTTLEDPEGRATIAEYLKDLPARVFPVGRLDFHTSGALLLTNDGDLAQALLHPRRSVPKTYVAKVRGVPTDQQVETLRAGVELEPVAGETPPVRTRPADVEVLRSGPPGEGARSEDGTTWLKVTLREGRNRQIHRMSEAVGLFVMRLARIAFAGITTERIRPGELRPLTDKEVTNLRATYLRPVEAAAGKGGEIADEESPRAQGGAQTARSWRDDNWITPAEPRGGGGGGGDGGRGANRGGRGERGPRAQWGQREERGARDERGPRTGRGARDDRGPRGDRGPRAARSEGIERSGRVERGGPAERGGRNERDARGPRGAQGAAGGRGPRSDRFARDGRGPGDARPEGGARGPRGRGARDGEARGAAGSAARWDFDRAAPSPSRPRERGAAESRPDRDARGPRGRPDPRAPRGAGGAPRGPRPAGPREAPRSGREGGAREGGAPPSSKSHRGGPRRR